MQAVSEATGVPLEWFYEEERTAPVFEPQRFVIEVTQDGVVGKPLTSPEEDPVLHDEEDRSPTPLTPPNSDNMEDHIGHPTPDGRTFHPEQFQDHKYLWETYGKTWAQNWYGIAAFEAEGAYDL